MTNNRNKQPRCDGQMSQSFIKSKPFIAGLWKFRNTIPLATLTTLAERWAETDDGYAQLFIRQVEHGENGIAFIYQPYVYASLDDYIRTTSQELKKTFGNDLTGWDVAVSQQWIKC